jgi:hypothetical protein
LAVYPLLLKQIINITKRRNENELPTQFIRQESTKREEGLRGDVNVWGNRDIGWAS